MSFVSRGFAGRRREAPSGGLPPGQYDVGDRFPCCRLALRRALRRPAGIFACSDGGYTTNLPLSDLTDGQAWVVDTYDGQPLEPEHRGPARLLVPHLYFWKSAK